MAGNMLQDFLAAQDQEPVKPLSPISHQWRPPELNQYKVNFNAAVFRATNSAGIGVVGRDLRGESVGALSVLILLAQSVADMEALAGRRAVEFAAAIGLRRVVFEGDSTMIINAINQGTAGFSTH